MIREHESAVLLVDLPEHGLKSGDVGTVVSVHDAGAGYTIEFFSLSGETLSIVTLRGVQVRPVSRRDVSHVRQLAEA